MGGDQSTNDGEANPGSARSDVATAEEPVEHQLTLIGGNPRAGIAYPDQRPPLVLLELQAHAAARWGELGGVAEEVGGHLTQTGSVSLDLDVAIEAELEAHLAVGEDAGHLPGHDLEQRAQGHHLEAEGEGGGVG